MALFASACNWTFGVGNVVERDATFFDASPPSCPPIGTVPVFDHADLREIVPQNCTDYARTPGSARALASCETGIFEGTPDDLLVPAPGLEHQDGILALAPHLAPDGVTAFITYGTPIHRDLVRFRRDADAWVIVETLSPYESSSEPTAGPNPRMIAGRGYSFYELSGDDNGHWTEMEAVDLGSSTSYHLSPDGLRIVATTTTSVPGVIYYDRSSIDEPFVNRGPIANGGGFTTAFLTADCGRLYFSTLNSVWFAHQMR